MAQQSLAATTLAMAMPALLFRPQGMWGNADDLRHAHCIPSEILKSHDERAPVVLRMEAFSNRQNQKNFVGAHTQEPSISRFRGGTAIGGILILPPEVDLADSGSNYAPAGITRSSTYFMIGPGAFFAAGRPDFATGHGTSESGWRWGSVAGSVAGQDLRFSAFYSGAADGIADPTMDLEWNTGNMKLFYSLRITKGQSVFWVDANDQIRFDDSPSWQSGTDNVLTFNSFNGVWVFRHTETSTIRNRISGLANVETVFNEQGADSDFRVEGDTDANLLFIDASTDRMGVGTSSPASKLHVVDNNALGIRIERTSGTAGSYETHVTSGGIWNFRDITNSRNMMQLSTPADQETAWLVSVNRTGTFSVDRVSLGATDSGGVGFKLLRVAN